MNTRNSTRNMDLMIMGINTLMFVYNRVIPMQAQTNLSACMESGDIRVLNGMLFTLLRNQ